VFFFYSFHANDAVVYVTLFSSTLSLQRFGK